MNLMTALWLHKIRLVLGSKQLGIDRLRSVLYRNLLSSDIGKISYINRMMKLNVAKC